MVDKPHVEKINKLKRTKLFTIVSIIIPVVIVLMLFFMMFYTSKFMHDSREYYVDTFLNIIEISIREVDDVYKLNHISRVLTDYINENEEKPSVVVYMYTDDFKPARSMDTSNHPFDFYNNDSDLQTLLLADRSGRIPGQINDVYKDVHYQWMFVPLINKDILIVYSISDSTFDISLVYMFSIIIMVLIFSYIIMFHIRDIRMSLKIVQRNNKSISLSTRK